MAREDGTEKVNIQKINRLGAAIRTGYSRGGTFYLGWSEGGTPVISWDDKSLSDSAKESLNISKTIGLPDGISIDDKHPMEPIQYMASLSSIDKPDTENEYTEDILVIGVANSQGMTDYLHIGELDMMEGIINGHIVWQDVNSHTVLATDDVTPTLPMHSVIFDARTDDGKKVTYAMLFEPTMPSESNEVAFKLFLAQTLKSFLALDSRQPEGAKKGYEKVLRDFQDQKDVGGDAFVIMKALKDMGFASNITGDRLDKIWRESAGKGFTYQLLLLGREFGLLNFNTPDSQAIKTEVEKMDVNQLMDLIKMCYKVVSHTFKVGK